MASELVRDILRAVAPEALMPCASCGALYELWHQHAIVGQKVCPRCAMNGDASGLMCEICGLTYAEGCDCWCLSCGTTPSDTSYCDDCLARMHADANEDG